MLAFKILPVLVCMSCVWLLSACANRSLPVATAPSEAPPMMTATVAIFAPTPLPSATPLPPPVHSPTPEAHPDDLPDYYGGLVITMDYVGQTLAMKPGQGFLLRLSEEFLWTVQVSPGDLLTQNLRFTPEANEQGVYIARKKGVAVLSAVGQPMCSEENPPCSWPTVLFQFTVDIQ